MKRSPSTLFAEAFYSKSTSSTGGSTGAHWFPGLAAANRVCRTAGCDSAAAAGGPGEPPGSPRAGHAKRGALGLCHPPRAWAHAARPCPRSPHPQNRARTKRGGAHPRRSPSGADTAPAPRLRPGNGSLPGPGRRPGGAFGQAADVARHPPRPASGALGLRGSSAGAAAAGRWPRRLVPTGGREARGAGGAGKTSPAAQRPRRATRGPSRAPRPGPGWAAVPG